MCGISIAVSKNGEPASMHTIQSMTDCVQHRGPGGEGFYLYKNIALGHRRLAIIDLSAAGNQPMHWKDDLTIIFNGEIYNYLELRHELGKHGYSFSSHTDTEVILAAYNYWGTACQHRFNGMWAFAILDKQNQTLFCSRDRFGVKPFYYTDQSDGFYAGSEIKQLLPLIASRKVNAAALADYLLLDLNNHSTDTFFDRIKQLKGGHELVYDLKKNTFSINQWYQLTFHEEINKLSEAAFLKQFKIESQRAIRWRMRSDVRIGTCLSGGLDSSYIAALSASQHNASNPDEPFNAITAQSIQKETDETAYAEMVAHQYELEWNITAPVQQDFEKVLEEVIKIQEEPFADLSVYMQYFVMQQAKESGITVLLDGQGADESLLGYSRYIFQTINQHGLFKKLLQLPQIKEQYGLSLKETLLQAFYFNNQKLRFQKRKHNFCHLREDIANACRSDQYLVQPDTLKDLQQQEMLTNSLPLLLRFEDKNSMHFSIETRLPFLDWQLVETIFSMNDTLRFKNGWSKYILRKANEKILPPKIAWRRKKLGFVAPAAKWLSCTSKIESEIKSSPFLNQLFNNKIPQSKNLQMLWKLYNLHKWASLFDAHL